MLVGHKEDLADYDREVPKELAQVLAQVGSTMHFFSVLSLHFQSSVPLLWVGAKVLSCVIFISSFCIKLHLLLLVPYCIVILLSYNFWSANFPFWWTGMIFCLWICILKGELHNKMSPYFLIYYSNIVLFFNHH